MVNGNWHPKWIGKRGLLFAAELTVKPLRFLCACVCVCVSIKKEKTRIFVSVRRVAKQILTQRIRRCFDPLDFSSLSHYIIISLSVGES
jgi:hypothetical protein